MPYIGNQIALEDTQDRKAYTGDGSRTVFGITFSDNLFANVQMYLSIAQATISPPYLL